MRVTIVHVHCICFIDVKITHTNSDGFSFHVSDIIVWHYKQTEKTEK